MCEPCTLRNRERNGLEGNKLAVRKYQLRKYGLTVESYADMLDEQGGVCAICGEGNPLDKNLHVDHCHDTGRVRGLLCAACNKGIGMLRDNAATVYAAARYLERATA